MVRVLRNRLVIAYLILASATTVALFFSFQNDRDINRARVERVKQINVINEAQCSSLRNLYRVIADTIAVSDRSIDQIAYYKDHPAEAAAAHAANDATIARFKRPACPPNVTLDH